MSEENQIVPSLTDLVSSPRAWEDSVEKMAKTMLMGTKWTIPGIRITKKMEVFLEATPMRCDPFTCKYREKCDVIREMTDEQKEALIGTSCRSEILFGVRRFTDHVRELGLDPGATSDISVLATLIRLEILRRRTDWDIAITGLTDEEPVVGRDGVVRGKRVPHPLFKVLKDLDDQISKQYKMLVATRAEKLKVAKDTEVGKRAILQVLDVINQEAIIDAEYEDVSENPPEVSQDG